MTLKNNLVINGEYGKSCIPTLDFGLLFAS